MKRTLKFLRSLRRHNNREWFNAHKDEYLIVKSNVEKLTQELLNILSEYIPDAARLGIGDCTYRIYRDTRFSSDKTPYKTHIGIFINPPAGKKGLTAGYYLHLEPDASFFYSGSYALPTALVNKQRKEIYDEIDEFREIVENEEFKALYTELGFDHLKNVPRGYPRDWEWGEYLKPRNFGASAYLSDEFISSPGLAERLRPYIEQGVRLNRFLNYPLEDLD